MTTETKYKLYATSLLLRLVVILLIEDNNMSKVIGMNTKIKFDREIDKDKHYISIGGFEFGIGKDTVQFDFNSSYGYINEDDNKIISFNLEYLDEESFKNCGNKLTKDFCKNIDNIEEFFLSILVSMTIQKYFQ